MVRTRLGTTAPRVRVFVTPIVHTGHTAPTVPPVAQPGTRKFVAIKAGQLVRVKGDRDSKYLVIADPEQEVRSVRRKGPTMVQLLAPDGTIVSVRLGWCIPFYG